MRTCWLCAVLLFLVGWKPAAQAGNYLFQGKTFVQDGVVTKVDADRDRVVLQGDDGLRYTLDMTDSNIRLRDGNRAGTTSDLKPGMRVHVSGKLLSANIAEALQVHVLDTVAMPPRPRQPRGPQSAPSGPHDPDAITLRGTVDKIDTQTGEFDVKVKDHTRTILLADDTDLSGLGTVDPQAFPVKPGDRVTVAGALQPDGMVLAGAISFSRDIAFPAPAALPRVLVGRVSSTSNRYSTRDIKIRLASGREVKIKVPRGISVRRDGQPISVHDLHGDELVRVMGVYDGDDFQANRIEVVRPAETGSPGGFSRL